MKCKDCKHWKMPPDNEYWGAYELAMPQIPPDYEHIKDEKEQRELFGYAIKYCRSPKLLFYQRPDKDGACVADGSQYRACMITGEDFGCTNFESDYKIVNCYPINTLTIDEDSII